MRRSAKRKPPKPASIFNSACRFSGSASRILPINRAKSLHHFQGLGIDQEKIGAHSLNRARTSLLPLMAQAPRKFQCVVALRLSMSASFNSRAMNVATTTSSPSCGAPFTSAVRPRSRLSPSVRSCETCLSSDRWSRRHWSLPWLRRSRSFASGYPSSRFWRFRRFWEFVGACSPEYLAVAVALESF